MKINAWTILFILALAYIIYEGFRPNNSQVSIFIEDTLIAGDPHPYFIHFPVPVPYKTVLPPDSFFHSVDTAKILEQCKSMARDHYSVNFYNSVLLDDSSAFLQLFSHTHQNQFFIDSLGFQNRRPALIRRTERIFESAKPRFYLGLGTGFDVNSFDFTAAALLTLPNRIAVSYQRGLRSKCNYFTLYYSFGFKRNL